MSASGGDQNPGAGKIWLARESILKDAGKKQ